MKRSSFLFTSIVLCCVLSSCTKSNEHTPAIAKNIELPQNAAEVTQAGNRFAFDFLHQAVQDDPDQNNKLISPLSIYLALSMTYNGADSTTRDAIKHALNLDNVSINDLNKTCQALIEQLPAADNKVIMSIANSIWYSDSKQPLPAFLTTTHEFYHATVNALDFGNSESVNTINKWASDNTQQKITSILERIDPDALMFLINAIYFKGNWQYIFDKNATQNRAFTLGDNSTVSIPFMNLRAEGLGYFGDSAMQMVQLPYGGGNFNMYVIVPRNATPINEFASGIDAASFQTWQSGMRASEVSISLPKFKYSYSVKDMKAVLAKMGMEIAFSDRADFSKMYDVGAKITEAVHKTFIEVNEEGTEAAAVTSIGIGPTNIGPVTMNVDRPFLYIIAEKTSNTVLFTGIVNNPEEH